MAGGGGTWAELGGYAAGQKWCLILAKLPHDLDHITNGQWIGTAEELEQVLTHKDSPVQRQALQVLSYPSACGTYLARLRDQPEPAVSDKWKHGTRYWIIPLSPP